MNWRTILVKGLPVVLIAAVIILIAVIAGRPKPLPKVSNENETIIDFKGLTIDKASLYDMMKQNGGLNTLLNSIDRSLLANYNDKIDKAALDKEIADAKDTQGEDFDKNMTNLGVILGADDPDKETKIEDYYMTKYLQKAYARDVAVKALDQADVEKAKADYKEDLCIITLKYTVKSDAQKEIDTIKSATSALDQFKTDWHTQNPNGVTKPELPDFLKDFTCDYEIAEYNNYSVSQTELRDYIFSDAIAVGSYNDEPKLIGTNYYIIYKEKSAPLKSTYPQAEFTEYITNKLLGNKVTDTYVQTQVKTLRSNSKFKLYDTKLAEQYASVQTGFKAEKHLTDKYTVASYVDGNGNVVKITADDLYNELKPMYAVQTILDKVNYAALKSIPEIKLSKSDLASYTEQVKTLKSQFLANGYGQYIPWNDYIAAYYGAFSEAELADKFASQELSKRYLLGKDGYTGVDPVSQADIDQAYADWFKIQASHIFFTFTSGDTDEAKASKDLAKEKANQIIYGCKAKTDAEGTVIKDANGKTVYVSNVPGSTSDCYITYNNEGFKGLENIEVSTYSTVFASLAKTYSNDPSASQNSGDLGYFGPGQMVPEFENAAKEIASRGKNNYSVLPVESTVKTATETLHGYHVILVTNIQQRVEKPAGYDEITDPSKSSDQAVKAYYNFMQTIKTDLESKRTTSDNYAKYLADLRTSLGFKFINNDEVLTAHYNAITAQQAAFDRKADTTTPTE